MKLGEYKLIFVAVGLIGALLIASPAIAGAIRPPSEEQFSELYLLGPNQMAQNYPSNIAIGQNYSVYVNVANHLGSSTYYVLYVKLANATDQLPNTTLGTPSPLAPLYEYRLLHPRQHKLAEPTAVFSFQSHNPRKQFTNQHPKNKRPNIQRRKIRHMEFKQHQIYISTIL